MRTRPVLLLFATIVVCALCSLRSQAELQPFPLPVPPAPTAPPVPTTPPTPTIPPVPSGPNVQIPGIDRLLRSDDPITTSFSDAVTQVPYLDDYTPDLSIPLQFMPHGADGVFRLQGGAYTFEARSYCMHAGKYGPSSGDGYLYAPLKGQDASIIHTILVNSANHLEIPQQNVQQLIWAILARAKIGDEAPDIKRAALTLLSPTQVALVGGDSVGFVPASMQSQVFAEVSDPLKPVFEAENSLRGMVESNATYEQMEKVAVISGSAPPIKGGPVIPDGRWSYSPQGFFIRYFGFGYGYYQHTTETLYVPEKFNISRDARGRIVSIADPTGGTIDVSYDDSVASPAITGDNQVRAYALRSFRFIQRRRINPPTILVQQTWDHVGWILTGIPKGSGQIASSAQYDNAQDRYDEAVQLRAEFNDMVHRLSGGHSSDVTDLVAIAELRAALAHAVATNPNWLVGHMLNRITNAWQSALAKTLSPTTVVGEAISSGGDPSYDPSSGVAAPANTGAQRLAQSPACYPTGYQKGLQNTISLGAQNGGQNIPADAVIVNTFGAYPTFAVLFDQDTKPISSPGCETGFYQMWQGNFFVLNGKTYVHIVDSYGGEPWGEADGSANGAGYMGMEQAMEAAMHGWHAPTPPHF
jgi:hypothetical protein